MSSISEEQLQEEWKEIEALGLEGPDALEYARLIQLHNPLLSNSYITIEDIINFQSTSKVNQGFNNKSKNETAGNYQYAMAA